MMKVVKEVLGNFPLLSPATLFRFCRKREAAIASSEIIRLIAAKANNEGEQKSPEESDTQPKAKDCLGATIRELVSRPTQKEGSHPADRYQQIRDLFIGGVQLQQCFLSQARIKDVTAEGVKEQIKINLFTFYPTWTTTSHVFKFLTERRNSQFMFTGEKGVGKTASFILYSILMNKIAGYAMSVDEETAKRQIREGTILMPQKFIYWSYKSDLKWEEIIDQCPEMYEGNRKQFKYEDLITNKVNQFQTRAYDIQRFYGQNGIKPVVIIDQMNALAAEYRLFNNQFGKSYPKENQSQCSKRKMKLYQNNEQRNIIATIGENVIYNSSILIEQQLLGKATDYRQTMRIGIHEKLQYRQLGYKFRSREKESIQEFIYFTGLEFKRHYPHLTEADVEQLWKCMESQQLAQTESLLTLRQALQTIKQLKKQPKDVKELWMAFNQIMQGKKKEQFKKLKEFIQKRRVSGDAIEQEKMLFIIAKIYSLIKDEPSSNEKLWIKRKELFQLLKDRYSDIEQESDVDKYMDLSIFPYSAEENEKGYLCPLNTTALENLVRNTAHELFKAYVKRFYDRHNVGPSSRQNIAVFGVFTEDFIMKAIQEMIYQKQKFLVSFPGFIKSPIGAKSHFIQLNSYKKGAEEDYTNRFKEMIEMAKQEQSQFIYGEPRTKNAPNGTKSKKSFCVDIGFVKYDHKRQKSLQFVFVDVKTGDNIDYKAKNEDALQFKRRLALSLQEYKGKYTVQIIVLCPAKKIPKAEESRKYPNVTFADISQFKFHTESLNENVMSARFCLQMLSKL